MENFQERILKGLEFHRLRGTPISLKNALSWYGFDDIIIEEEPPGEHFYDFQIGLKEIPILVKTGDYSKFGLRLLRKNARVHGVEDQKMP